jgi:hypothetical protein
MNAACACTLCAREIVGTSAHSVTEWSTVLCAACAENPGSRAVMYPHCSAAAHTVAAHTVAAHAVVVGTRLAAHRWQLRLRRAQEVSAG